MLAATSSMSTSSPAPTGVAPPGTPSSRELSLKMLLPSHEGEPRASILLALLELMVGEEAVQSRMRRRRRRRRQRFGARELGAACDGTARLDAQRVSVHVLQRSERPPPQNGGFVDGGARKEGRMAREARKTG
jgi:hypothetical protein